jgi:hypothetical protein
MLEFKQDDTAVELILTLTEYVTIPTPYYLFVFTHVVTKDQVVFVKGEIDDESLYPDRFNEFTINAATLFAGKQTGEWHYEVYQQDNGSNLNPALTNGLLERGKLMLVRTTEFAFTMYNQAQTFKMYNG